MCGGGLARLVDLNRILPLQSIICHGFLLVLRRSEAEDVCWDGNARRPVTFSRRRTECEQQNQQSGSAQTESLPQIGHRTWLDSKYPVGNCWSVRQSFLKHGQGQCGVEHKKLPISPNFVAASCLTWLLNLFENLVQFVQGIGRTDALKSESQWLNSSRWHGTVCPLAGYDECKVPIPDYPRPAGCSHVAELFFEVRYSI